MNIEANGDNETRHRDKWDQYCMLGEFFKRHVFRETMPAPASSVRLSSVQFDTDSLMKMKKIKPFVATIDSKIHM